MAGGHAQCVFPTGYCCHLSLEVFWLQVWPVCLKNWNESHLQNYSESTYSELNLRPLDWNRTTLTRDLFHNISALVTWNKRSWKQTAAHWWAVRSLTRNFCWSTRILGHTRHTASVTARESRRSSEILKNGLDNQSKRFRTKWLLHVPYITTAYSRTQPESQTRNDLSCSESHK